MYLRQRRRQEGLATLIKEKEQRGQVIEDKLQKGRDQGSGAYTRDQHREAWKTAESCGVTESGSSSTNRPTITVRVFGLLLG